MHAAAGGRIVAGEEEEKKKRRSCWCLRLAGHVTGLDFLTVDNLPSILSIQHPVRRSANSLLIN